MASTTAAASPLTGARTTSASAAALRVHIASFPQASQCAPLISAALDAVSLAVKRSQLYDAQRLTSFWADGDASRTVSTVLGAEVRNIDKLLAAIKAAAAPGNMVESAVAAVGGAGTSSSLSRPETAGARRTPNAAPAAAAVARRDATGSAARGTSDEEDAQLASVLERQNGEDDSVGEDLPTENVNGHADAQDAAEDKEIQTATSEYLEKHFTVDGEESYVPADWKFPAKLNTRTFLQRWYLADPDNPEIPPLRYLKGCDLGHVPRGSVYMGEARTLIRLMTLELKRQGIRCKSNPTEEDVDDWYDRCRKLLFDNFETGGGKKCKALCKMDGKTWVTVYKNVIFGRQALDLDDGIIILPKKIARKITEFRERKSDGVIPITWCQCNIQEATRRWLVFGQLGPDIPALRHLHARNFPPMGQHQQYLLRYKRLMSLFVKEVKKLGLWRECPTADQVDDWYNKCGCVIKGNILSGDKKRRREDTTEDADEEDKLSC